MNVQKNQITLLIALAICMQTGFAHSMETESAKQNRIITTLKSREKWNSAYILSLVPVMLLSIAGQLYVEENHPNNCLFEPNAFVMALQVGTALIEGNRLKKQLTENPEALIPFAKKDDAKRGFVLNSATCIAITMITALACLNGRLETHSDAIVTWLLGAMVQAAYAYNWNENAKTLDDLALLQQATNNNNNNAIFNRAAYQDNNQFQGSPAYA